ncbi:MAG: NUDIX hydrolase [bacterium]
MSAIIHRRNEILFVQRAHEPFKHYWDFPGGFLEAGESPEAGLRREVREELQIEINILRLWNAYPDTYGPENTPVVVLYYYCTPGEGAIHQQEEIADVQWFTLSKPPEKLAFNHIPAVLSDLRAQ